MKKFFENQTFTNTNYISSSKINVARYQSKTIVIQNNTNKTINLLVYGLVAPDISAECLITADTNGNPLPIIITPQRTNYEVLLDYFPYLRMEIRVTDAVGITGTASVYLLSMEER